MSLYNFNAILKIAQERDFKAIGSFNLHCIEMLPAFFKAAQISDSPLMIQISTGTAEYLGYRLLVDAVRSLAESEDVPTCLHLDHPRDGTITREKIEQNFRLLEEVKREKRVRAERGLAEMKRDYTVER